MDQTRTGRDRPRQDRQRQAAQAARPRGSAGSGADSGRGATVTQLRAAPAQPGRSRAAQSRAAQPLAAQPREGQPRATPSRTARVRPVKARPAPAGAAQARPAQARPGTSRPDGGRTPLHSQRPGTIRLGPVSTLSETVRIARRSPAAGGSRTPFVLLLLAMLGGGLVCLLVINTTLGASSFEIDRLQQSATARQLQVQQLQDQVATDQNDATIQREACRLGMRPQQNLEFLDLRTHRLKVSTPTVASPAWCGR
jgi:hypothetical protein